jgi:O-antigen/teichoic acid export membrane protein
MLINLKTGEWLLILLIGLGVLLLGILFFTLVEFPAQGSEATLTSPQAWPVLLCLMPLVLLAAIMFVVSGILMGRKRADGRRGLKRERQIMVASGGFLVGLVLLSIFTFVF